MFPSDCNLRINSSLEYVDGGEIIDRIKDNIKIKYFTNES